LTLGPKARGAMARAVVKVAWVVLVHTSQGGSSDDARLRVGREPPRVRVWTYIYLRVGAAPAFAGSLLLAPSAS
jgi:hypothetical protein